VKQSLPILALQKAIYERLGSVLSVGVYESVPSGTDLPYAGIGTFSCSASNLKAQSIVSISGTIHVWSEWDSMQEVVEVTNDVLESLTGTPLVLVGWSVVSTTFVSYTASTDFDGTKTRRHGTLELEWQIL
jgi:hypothetical protein